jgi:hypothetical protein
MLGVRNSDVEVPSILTKTMEEIKPLELVFRSRRETDLAVDPVGPTSDDCIDDDDECSLDFSSLEPRIKPCYTIDKKSRNGLSNQNDQDEYKEAAQQRRQRLGRMREERTLQTRMQRMNLTLEVGDPDPQTSFWSFVAVVYQQ